MTLPFATDLSKHRYPGIVKAALEMAYDNGGVSRDRPESVTVKELGIILASGVDLAFDLQAISEWLSALSDADLSTAVAGEESDVATLMSAAPAGTDELLNLIFDGS